jgi:hypothetical protein
LPPNSNFYVAHPVLTANGTRVGDLLLGQAKTLNDAASANTTAGINPNGPITVSPENLMDISLLHELVHYDRKLANPDKNPATELTLWNNCIH